MSFIDKRCERDKILSTVMKVLTDTGQALIDKTRETPVNEDPTVNLFYTKGVAAVVKEVYEELLRLVDEGKL